MSTIPFYPISTDASPLSIPKSNSFGKIAIGYIPDLSSVYQPVDGDLTALAGSSGTGVAKRTGTNTWSVGALVAGDIPDLSGIYSLLNHIHDDRYYTETEVNAAIAALSAVYAPLSHNHAASAITSGLLALARGGTNADLSATGGANQFVKQTSVGGALAVAAILSADLTSALVAPPPIGQTTPAAVRGTTVDAAYASGMRLRNVGDTGWMNSVVGFASGNRFGDSAYATALHGLAVSIYTTDSTKRAMVLSSSGNATVQINPDFNNAPPSNTHFLLSGATSGRTLIAVYANGRDSVNFGTLSTETGHFVLFKGHTTAQHTLRIDKMASQTGQLIQIRDDAAVELGTLSTLGVWTSKPYDAVTNAVTGAMVLGHNSSGTPAAGFGSQIAFQLESSTTENTLAGAIDWLWNDATHASRKADVVISAYDTAKREGLRIRGAGSAAALGFFGTTPAARATGYTAFANLSTDRTLDANSTTLDEVADVLGTLIEDLKLLGLIAA